jgi:hypothetical protein
MVSKRRAGNKDTGNETKSTNVAELQKNGSSETE